MVDAGNRDAPRVEPDLAARQAVIASVGWLIIAVTAAVVAQARFVLPGPLAGLSVLSFGRLNAVALNTMTFGWLATAAFAATFGILPRAVSAQLHNEVLGTTTVIFWNLVMLAGVTTLLLGMNQGRFLAEFPIGIDLAIIAMLLLVAYNTVMTASRRNEKRLYVSVWYFVAAAVALPVVFATGNLTVFSGVADSVVAGFYNSGLEFLWLLPVGLGAAYFIVPMVTGNKLHSGRLASIGFWSLIFVGGWTGQRFGILGPSPSSLQAIAIAMTVVALVPVLSAASNLVSTMSGRWDTVQSDVAIRFVLTALGGLVAWLVLVIVSSLPSVSRIVGLTSWESGVRDFGIWMVFSMFAFAAIYFVFPLVVGRQWFSRRAVAVHQWMTVAGILILTVSKLSRGLVGGSLAYAGSTDSFSWLARGYGWVDLVALSVLAIGQYVFAYNAMKTSKHGEPVQVYVIESQTVGSAV